MTNTTLTPTYDDGTVAKATEMVYVPPDRQIDDDTIDSELADAGLNKAFVADLLSQMLAHERCGRHLYRSVAGRTNNPALKAKYEEFGQETERHAQVLEELIAAMGGNPQYISGSARATEGMDTKLVESTFLLGGSVNVMQRELAMLDAVLVAETVDHANWETFAAVVREMPEGDLRERMRAAVADIEDEEDTHLEWARTTRQRMVMLQAQSSTATTMGLKAEQMMETVRGWFSS